MPRKHKQAPDYSEPPRPKRQKLTDAQLERKRELDREAQRTIRERTKNRIAYLEGLVKVLQGDQDGRVERLVAQLNESKAEANRLKDALNNIAKITGGVITLPSLGSQDQSQPVNIKDDSASPTNTVLHAAATYQARGRLEAEFQDDGYDSRRASSYYNPRCDTGASSVDYNEVNEAHYSPKTSVIEVAQLNHTPEGSSVTEDVDTSRYSQPNPTESPKQEVPISKMASSIVRNTRLEGRFWYLAGVLLNHILKTQHEPLSSQDDEDIAIRAVFEGWPAVTKRYNLDRGWQWLKELDENLYINLSPSERLMHLRNCRLQCLHQVSPHAGWNQSLPDFYAARPSQKYLDHDPLIEYFPWPAFRERLLFFPTKFATNKFMEALRSNLHVIWPYDPTEIFNKNPHTGLYSYSDSFVRQLMDIRCYTARLEFFQQFPELRQDIPSPDPSPYNMLSTCLPKTTRRIAQYAEDNMESRRSDMGMNSWQLLDESYTPSRFRTYSLPGQVVDYSP